MSEHFPRLTAKQIIKILEKRGFKLARQSGSHKLYKNNDGIRVTVPYHSGKILPPKIVKSILKDMSMSLEELKKLL